MRRTKRILLRGGISFAVLAVAGYVFRKALLVFLLSFVIRPSTNFNPAVAPPPPDYATPAAWAALPDKDDASDWKPAGFKEADNPLRDQVDVFYIHPTGFMGKNNWNAALGELSKPGIPTEAMLASQASAFNGCGKVYAPNYREATLYSFIEHGLEPDKKNGYQALELAYSDVARAFDYFLEHYNHGRPFFLVSHSQGTCHALRLIAEKIDNTDVYKRMIAAYTVGFDMPMDMFDRVYKNVKPGMSPTQTGCILHWGTVREGVNESLDGFHYYPTGWESAKGKPRLCVNPLTWTTDEKTAPASANLGALRMDMTVVSGKLSPDMLKPLVPQQTWAKCHKGLLWVANLAGTPFSNIMTTGGNYHLYDFHLFWLNIRQNAVAREQAYFKAHPVTR